VFEFTVTDPNSPPTDPNSPPAASGANGHSGSGSEADDDCDICSDDGPSDSSGASASPVTAAPTDQDCGDICDDDKDTKDDDEDCDICTPLPPDDSATMKDLVQTAMATDALKGLVVALQLDGQKAVLQTLQGKGPFTVFAPTNGGFDALKLLKDANGESLYDFVTKAVNAPVLTQILKYHVVSGEVKAAAAEELAGKSSKVETLLGEEALLTLQGGSVMVDTSKVTATDVMTSNGVVHLIDNVLVPPSLRETVKTFTAEPSAVTPAPVAPVLTTVAPVEAPPIPTPPVSAAADALPTTLTFFGVLVVSFHF